MSDINGDDLEARLLALRMPLPPPPPDPKDEDAEVRLLALKLPDVPTHPIEPLEVTLARLDKWEENMKKGRKPLLRERKPYKCDYCNKRYYKEPAKLRHEAELCKKRKK